MLNYWKELKFKDMITKEELIKFMEWISDSVYFNGDAEDYVIPYLETIKPKEQDLSVEFEEFWKPTFGKKWTGSKTDAYNKFKKACKEVFAGDLLIAKHNYFYYLSVCSYDRPVMAGSVFLNTTTKRWTEAWQDYATDELRKQGKLSSTAIISESKKITNVNDLFS